MPIRSGAPLRVRRGRDVRHAGDSATLRDRALERRPPISSKTAPAKSIRAAATGRFQSSVRPRNQWLLKAQPKRESGNPTIRKRRNSQPAACNSGGETEVPDRGRRPAEKIL